MRNISKYKGQWFIMSAIFAAIALLAISNSFQGYYQVDNSVVELEDAHYYLDSYLEAQSKTNNTTPCVSGNFKNLSKSAEEIFFENSVVIITRYNGCDNQLVYVSTGNMESWVGTRPEIESVTKSGNTLQINLNQSVPYEFDIDVDIYTNIEEYFNPTTEIGTIEHTFQSNSMLGSITHQDLTSSDFIVIRSLLLIGKNEWAI